MTKGQRLTYAFSMAVTEVIKLAPLVGIFTEAVGFTNFIDWNSHPVWESIPIPSDVVVASIFSVVTTLGAGIFQTFDRALSEMAVNQKRFSDGHYPTIDSFNRAKQTKEILNNTLASRVGRAPLIPGYGFKEARQALFPNDYAPRHLRASLV